MGLKTIIATVCLALLIALPSASARTIGTPGPFVGVVTEGQTQSHFYSNTPPGAYCIDWFAPVSYTVIVKYEPAADKLTVSAGAASSTGSNGMAVVTIVRSWCTSFTISVTGTDVALAAAYTVVVQRGSADA